MIIVYKCCRFYDSHRYFWTWAYDFFGDNIYAYVGYAFGFYYKFYADLAAYFYVCSSFMLIYCYCC